MNPQTEATLLRLAAFLKLKHWTIALAESCTGGGLGYTLTQQAGSSAWFDRGYITYSNQAKNEQLGVDPQIIRTHGAVSEACVQAMLEGLAKHSRSQLRCAISGIAGPGGGSAEKPIGTVIIGVANPRDQSIQSHHFPGDREAVRQAAITEAIEQLLNAAQDPSVR